jgi:hypothetical protein
MNIHYICTYTTVYSLTPQNPDERLTEPNICHDNQSSLSVELSDEYTETIPLSMFEPSLSPFSSWMLFFHFEAHPVETRNRADATPTFALVAIY